ncbi:MAG: hypothetical protein K8F91_03905 [Candidatus Obscuribacterales bacterium]|nr:hypothetical protein [Candidatus Obscuribacterales bacterium]
MPRSLASPGSITQWIAVCRCNTVLDLESPTDEATVEICGACRKRIQQGRAGSLTQWIFRCDICSCKTPEPFQAPISMLSEATQLLDNLVDDQAELELELEPELESFPHERYKPLELLGMDRFDR